MLTNGNSPLLHVLTVNHSAFSTANFPQLNESFVSPCGPTQGCSQNEKRKNRNRKTEINNYNEIKTQTLVLAFPIDKDETRTKRNEAFRCTETER